MKEHQKTHSINATALILGIGRERLTFALAEAGTDTSKAITIAAAFAALDGKVKEAALRRRKLESETNTAEMLEGKKRDELMFTKDAELLWADRIIKWRKVIESQDKWDSGKLLVVLSKTKLDEL